MSRGIYTLEFPRQTVAVNNTNTNSPAVMLVCALSYALSVSISSSIPALFTALLMPMMFIVTGRFQLSKLVKINILNLIMIITLSLTWPIFSDGLIMGAVITLRVNMIYVVFGVTVYPLGTAGIYEAFSVLNVPMKLRVLVILTMRGIYVLSERYSSAITSVRLRAPGLSGMMRLKVFAYMMGNVLIGTSERSENIMRAVKCRGGFGGFMQSKNDGISLRDIKMIMVYGVYVLGIVLLNNA